MKLNLGCAHNKVKGWVNIDIESSVRPDMVADFNMPLPIKTNSIDKIRATFVIEHIRNLGLFFDEIHRVLKPKGTASIQTDYAHWLGYVFDHTGHHKGYKSPSEYKEDRHYFLFNETHLMNHARACGFEVINCKTYEMETITLQQKVIHMIFKSFTKLLGLERLLYPHIEITLKKVESTTK